jgi:hypothetical protein
MMGAGDDVVGDSRAGQRCDWLVQRAEGYLYHQMCPSHEDTSCCSGIYLLVLKGQRPRLSLEPSVN